MVRAATAAENGSVLAQVLENRELRYLDAVDYLFMAGLSRPAKKNEREMAQGLLQARQGNVREALQDVWWLCSIANHFCSTTNLFWS